MQEQVRSDSHGGMRLPDRLTFWASPAAALALIVLLVFIGPSLDRTALQFMTPMLMWIGLACSWNMVAGYARHLDLGHALYIGFGAYLAGLLLPHTTIFADNTRLTVAGLSPWQAIPAAFLLGLLLAALIGPLIMRLRGVYFALASFGLLALGGEIARGGLNLDQGNVSIHLLPPNPQPIEFYYVMLALMAAALLTSLWVYRAQMGDMLRALAQDEISANMHGINTTTIKVAIYMLAAGLSALIGAARAYGQGYIEPRALFSFEAVAVLLVLTYVGGIGRPWGPVVGGLVFFGSQIFFWPEQRALHLALMGILFVIVLWRVPRGILSLADPHNRGFSWRTSQHKDPTVEASDFEPLADAPEDVDLFRSREARYSGEILLEGRDITKDYSGLRVLNKINFQIKHGEIVGLIGPNGSGKTTLFDCISGITHASGGEVFLNGQDITRLTPWQVNRYGLARTFEEIRIFPDLTAYENMMLACRWRYIPIWSWFWGAAPAAHRQTAEVLAFWGLTDVSKETAISLSAAQQRLLDLGMALMSQPLLVLVDEPSSGLNAEIIETMKNRILHLNKEFNLSFFVIEHNLNLAMSLCDRLYVLDHGSLIAEGSPEEIQANPAVIDAYFGRA